MGQCRHRPEVCLDCMRKGGRCCSALHLPGAAAALATAAEALLLSGSDKPEHARWHPSSAGLEATFDYKGETVHVQLQPWLFCVSSADVALFSDDADDAAWKPLGLPSQVAICEAPNVVH